MIFILKELQFLDFILNELNTKYPEKHHKLKLQHEVITQFQNKYRFETKNKNKSDSADTILTQVYKDGVAYLHEHNFIIDDRNMVSITYNGIIKLSKGGFAKEYKSNRWDKRLQRIFWIAAAVSLFLSVLSFLNSI